MSGKERGILPSEDPDHLLEEVMEGIGRSQIATSDPRAIERFVKGGNAIFTIVSARSGERITFRVSELDRVWAVKYLAGPDNSDNSNYQYLGKVYLDAPDHYVHGGSKARAGVDSRANKAFAWFWRQLAAALRGQPSRLDQCEVWHEGKCGKCGRRLTVPESIATGLGPECSKMLGVAYAKPPSRRPARPMPQVEYRGRRTAPSIEQTEREMMAMEAEGDRQQTLFDEARKAEARSGVEALRRRFSSPRVSVEAKAI